jgi:hypothetical protein
MSVGIYFGSFSLGMTLYCIVFGVPLGLPVVKVAFIGAIAFLVAGVCVAAGDRIKPKVTVTN